MKTFSKILKISLGGLVGHFLLFAVAVIYAVTSYRFNRTHAAPPAEKMTLANDPAVIAQGGHIASGDSL